jgi:hypothetical protein
MITVQPPLEETAQEDTSMDMDVERPETPVLVDGEGGESADANSLASVRMDGIEGGETDGLSDVEMRD